MHVHVCAHVPVCVKGTMSVTVPREAAENLGPKRLESHSGCRRLISAGGEASTFPGQLHNRNTWPL